MLVPFKSLPKNSRIWIFPSSKEIDIHKKSKIKERLVKFISDWTSHNKNIQAGFELPYNRFIVIALNQNLQNASGCSIDSLINIIQIFEKEFDLILLDRMNVLYRDKTRKIEYLTLKDFVKMVKYKSINSSTTVFNNLVINKEEYMDLWEVPAINSWHSRYFKIKK
ncbi:MAG: ABC transporter ATPase [Flavobacteriaceae bacterium TMED206]|nr:MAG: ABC transporter ATPase [Flavobacteriaceae bacterium TMED206]